MKAVEEAEGDGLVESKPWGVGWPAEVAGGRAWESGY